MLTYTSTFGRQTSSMRTALSCLLACWTHFSTTLDANLCWDRERTLPATAVTILLLSSWKEKFYKLCRATFTSGICAYRLGLIWQEKRAKNKVMLVAYQILVCKVLNLEEFFLKVLWFDGIYIALLPGCRVRGHAGWRSFHIGPGAVVQCWREAPPGWAQSVQVCSARGSSGSPGTHRDEPTTWEPEMEQWQIEYYLNFTKKSWNRIL